MAMRLRRLLACQVLVSFALVTASCVKYQPGERHRTEVCVRAATTFAAALESYRREKGHYPAEKEELVPRYLPAESAFSVSYHGQPLYVQYYRNKDDSFALHFSWVSGFPSGISQRVYDSKTGRWTRGGYY